MDRETIIESITQGSPWDDAHIRRCIDMLSNEPDDVIRIYARCWLANHSVTIAERLLQL